jgi:hypothetical protein
MSPRLLVAAGGGGDAIAAAMLHAATTGKPPAHVATFAWERLLVDPLPGPRDPTWFTGLRPVGRRNHAVTPTTVVRPPAGSTLPRLAAELPATLYLLDPRGGASGLQRQLLELVGILQADRVQLVDVGGDVIAAGDEPELRSPLADGLTVAAAASLDRPTDVLVAGAGLDGELPEQHVLDRCRDLGGTLAHRLTASDARPFGRLFDWHPSETTGLLWAAAMGLRGTAEVRGDGLTVRLSDHSSAIYRLDHAAVLAHSRIARALLDTHSLAEADAALTAIGMASEIGYERTKAATLGDTSAKATLDVEDALRRLDRYAADASRSGIDFLTLRRVAEVLGLRQAGLARLTVELRRRRPRQYQPPLWVVRDDHLPG